MLLMLTKVKLMFYNVQNQLTFVGKKNEIYSKQLQHCTTT